MKQNVSVSSPMPYCGDITESESSINSLKRVKQRQKVVNLESAMKESIASGSLEDVLDDCTLQHYFAPVVDEYGCGTYAREMTIPKGTVIVGKIHRHSHINIISKGEVSVVTEHGKKYYTAPCTFVSEVGLKRAVYAEEETIWTTIHLTKHISEDNLDEIEDEVISKTYEEIGFIASEEEFNLLSENKIKEK
jgi:hypothetical protein